MFNRLRHRLRRNFYRAMENNDVTLEQLKQMQNEGATIIDARSPLEYKEGHIQGAISLPEYEIRKNINKYIKNQNEKIVLYCQTGHRSKRAQNELLKMGYNNVFNLYNGLQNYWDFLLCVLKCEI